MDTLTPKEILLKYANTKEAPTIKRTREIHNTNKRTFKRYLFAVNIDFLIKYTDIWYRNRYPDTNRVNEIMKSIKTEGGIDNRIYLAHIKDNHDPSKLLCFDGNHRREALIRLYRKEGFNCRVDLDVLIDASDSDVKEAFYRINQAVNLPEVYLELEGIETQDSMVETFNNPIQRCESFVKQFNTEWDIIVDKKTTRAPYCTKNTFIELVYPIILLHKEKELMKLFLEINQNNKSYQYSAQTDKICKEKNCYIFARGLEDIRRKIDTLK